jgi:glutaredoxin
VKKVTIYALSTCPWCNKTKEYFTTKGVPFQAVDYDLSDASTQAAILAELDAEGVSGFPFVRIGGAVVSGYQPVRFAALLGGNEARP